MILGLVGKYGSGKDSAADILKEYGFKHYSLSDEIRRELKKKGIRETREALIAMGNMLRKNQGNGVLAKRALMTLSKEMLMAQKSEILHFDLSGLFCSEILPR